MNVKLTALELQALAPLYAASSANGHDFGILDEVQWERGPKSMGGIVASLMKKGVIKYCVRTDGLADGSAAAQLTQFAFADHKAVKSLITILPRPAKKAGKDVYHVMADWKDIQGLADGFAEACRHFGLTVKEDPRCAGSDTFGYIVTKE